MNIIEIFNHLEKSIGVRVVYIHDDSKFKLKTHQELHIKILRSVSLGFSWYESVGFQPVDCPYNAWAMKGTADQCFDQSVRLYRSAVKAVQETPIITLKRIFSLNETTKKKWQSFFNHQNSLQSFDSSLLGMGIM
eukprot:UN33020